MLLVVGLPADQYVSYSRPLHWAVAAEGEARLAVDVLRVADVRAVVALIDGHVYPCSFGVRLQIKNKGDVSPSKISEKSTRNIMIVTQR